LNERSTDCITPSFERSCEIVIRTCAQSTTTLGMILSNILVRLILSSAAMVIDLVSHVRLIHLERERSKRNAI
jgi:hypothetical protein